MSSSAQPLGTAFDAALPAPPARPAGKPAGTGGGPSDFRDFLRQATATADAATDEAVPPGNHDEASGHPGEAAPVLRPKGGNATPDPASSPKRGRKETVDGGQVLTMWLATATATAQPPVTAVAGWGTPSAGQDRADTPKEGPAETGDSANPAPLFVPMAAGREGVPKPSGREIQELQSRPHPAAKPPQPDEPIEKPEPAETLASISQATAENAGGEPASVPPTGDALDRQESPVRTTHGAATLESAVEKGDGTPPPLPAGVVVRAVSDKSGAPFAPETTPRPASVPQQATPWIADGATRSESQPATASPNSASPHERVPPAWTPARQGRQADADHGTAPQANRVSGDGVAGTAEASDRNDRGHAAPPGLSAVPPADMGRSSEAAAALPAQAASSAARNRPGQDEAQGRPAELAFSARLSPAATDRIRRTAEAQSAGNQPGGGLPPDPGAAGVPGPPREAAEAEPAAAPAEPTPAAAPRNPAVSDQGAGASAHRVDLELNGAGGRVQVRLVERAGEVHVAVRTGDGRLAETMRDDLPALAARLEQSGFHGSEWRAGMAGGGQRTLEIGQPAASGSESGRNPGDTGRQHPGQQQEQQRPHPETRASAGRHEGFGSLISSLRETREEI